MASATGGGAGALFGRACYFGVPAPFLVSIVSFGHLPTCLIGASLQDIQEADICAASGNDAACAALSKASKEALMATGTVKFFNIERGFGFIEPSDGSKDVFVHISAVQRADMDTLVEGQKLTYDVIQDRGKSAADNLQSA